MASWECHEKGGYRSFCPFNGLRVRFGRRSGGAALHQGAGSGRAVYNWGGFYIGGHIGGAWTNEQWVNTANTTAFGDLAPGQGFRQRGTGVFGGGQVGYNWQASNFVFGLEGTISGLDNHGSVLNTVFGVGLDDRFSWRADWMATITGRAGFAVNNNLFYVKGGYAGVNNRLSVVRHGTADAVGLVDPVAQRLDRRRRLGIRHHRELDRRTSSTITRLREQELSARWCGGSGCLHLRCQAARHPVGCGSR